MTDYKSEIAQILATGEVGKRELEELIAASDFSGVDYALPCFKLCARFKKSPPEAAQMFLEKLRELRPEFIDDVAVAGGYLNIKLKRMPFVNAVLGGAQKPFEPKNETVVIDYSSINIAKDFHIGHLMSTAIGGSLHKIFKFLGYKTVGVNHIGDYGTQFGKLIAAYKKWGESKNWQNTMENLTALYVRFHKEEEENPEIANEGRAWFKKIEEGDAEALGLFRLFKEITLKEADKVYDLLGIKFDSYNGESFYNDKMGEVVDLLKSKALLTESEGALVVDLSPYDMPPCLILKSDGASLYATRDLAAALYRKKTYGFKQNLYVVAYQQNLHFKQIFKVLELLGFDWAKDCVHVPFGMVSIEGMGALSTRKGNVIKLKDVLNTSIQKIKEVIEAKNPDLKGKDAVSVDVGIGAVVFYVLYNSRIKDVSFSYEKALSYEGETGPYLQYTHARCCSLLNKCADAKTDKIDYNVLADDVSYAVVKNLYGFSGCVLESAKQYEPSVISRYLIKLAQSFNRFYIEHRIAGEPENVLNARIALVKQVKEVLKQGMELILLKAPESM